MKVYVSPTAKQIEATKFLLARNNGVCNYATGLGKSLIQMMVGMRLIQLGKVDKVIFIGTKSSSTELQADAEVNTDIRPRIYRTEEEMDKFFSGEEQFGILEYQRFYKSFLKGQGMGTYMDQGDTTRISNYFKSKRYAVLFDEIHLMNNPESVMYRVFHYLRFLWFHTYGFTATPVMSNPDDLYWIFNFIAPNHLGDHYAFRSRYYVFVKKKVSKTKIVSVVDGYKNLDHLATVAASVMITHFPKRDIRFERLSCPLDDIDAYYKAAKQAVSLKNFSDGMCNLQYVVDRDEAKKRLLKSVVLDRIASGCVIYSCFKESITVLSGVLDGMGVDYRVFSGASSTKERKNIKAWFSADSTNKVVIISMAGAQSVNLQATNEIVLYDIPQAIGHFIQTIGRVARMNSKYNHFRVTMLTVLDTIDDYKYTYVTMKRELIETLFDNDALPHGAFSDYSHYMLSNLRNALLWKRRQPNYE